MVEKRPTAPETGPVEPAKEPEGTPKQGHARAIADLEDEVDRLRKAIRYTKDGRVREREQGRG